jgi:hypothetical protein
MIGHLFNVLEELVEELDRVFTATSKQPSAERRPVLAIAFNLGF